MEVTHGSLVGQKEVDGIAFPGVLVPHSGKEPSSASEVIEWVKEKKGWLEEQLVKHGVLFFHGLPIETAEQFNDFVSAFDYPSEPYLGGGGPRISVVGHVMTSTESPPHFVIPFHHELAYVTTYPKRLFFWCEKPATEGGETPVCLSYRIYQRIEAELPEFLQKVKEKKIRYLRSLSDKYAPDFSFDYQKGWQDIFGTENREEAEKGAKQSGTDTITWGEDGTMHTVSVPFDGVVLEPRTQKYTWFNSAVLLHPCIHGDEPRPWRSIYGDHSEIASEDLKAVAKIMKEESAALQWNRGDIMLVDNLIALHSRNSFTPPRRLLAAMFS